MSIDRLCNVRLPNPFADRYLFNGVRSRRPNDLSFAPTLLHMAPIISMVHGVSKRFVRSCCTKATDLGSPKDLSDFSDGSHANRHGGAAGIDQTTENCDDSWSPQRSESGTPPDSGHERAALPELGSCRISGADPLRVSREKVDRKLRDGCDRGGLTNQDREGGGRAGKLVFD